MHNNFKIATVSIQTLIFFSIVWPPFLARQIFGLESGSALLSDDGSAIRQAVYLMIFLVAIIILLRNRETTYAAIRRVTPWLWLFLAYIMMSVIWSSDIILTIKRMVLLLGTAVVGLAFVASSIRDGASKQGFFSTVRPLVTVLVLASLAYSFSFPQFGAHQEGAWRGLAFDKNSFGQIATLCSLLWIIALREKAVNFGRGLLWLSVSALALLLSRSTTSLVALTAAVFVLLMFTCATSLGRSLGDASQTTSYGTVCLLTLLTLMLAGHLIAVFLGYPAPIELLERVATHLGKDLTLTGRTYLWQLMWDEIMRHPWLGTGYQAFWNTLDASSPLTAGFTGGKGHGHNGYLDLLNELGILGAGLMIMVVLSHAWNLVRLQRIYPITAQNHMVLLFAALLLNAAETVLFQPVKLWSIVVLVSIMEVSCTLKCNELADYSNQP